MNNVNKNNFDAYELWQWAMQLKYFILLCLYTFGFEKRYVA